MTGNEANTAKSKADWSPFAVLVVLLILVFLVCLIGYRPKTEYKDVEFKLVVDRSFTADVVERVQAESDGRLEFIRTEFDGRKSVLFFNGKILRSEEIKLLRVFSDEFGKMPDDKTEM